MKGNVGRSIQNQEVPAALKPGDLLARPLYEENIAGLQGDVADLSCRAALSVFPHDEGRA
ncbi:MAG: hypothetical protein MZV70_12285 [Desulfobacterales bacterium]|nr:hypothetical protein [Desulfobacterales bacterium]